MDRSASLKGSQRDACIGCSAASGWEAAWPTVRVTHSATTKSPFVDTIMKIQVTVKAVISKISLVTVSSSGRILLHGIGCRGQTLFWWTSQVASDVQKKTLKGCTQSTVNTYLTCSVFELTETGSRTYIGRIFDILWFSGDDPHVLYNKATMLVNPPTVLL